MRGLQQIAPWVIHDQPDTSDTAAVLLVPVLHFYTITRSFGTFQLSAESLGQHTSFAVSLGCDCSGRHRNSTHRCESHDSASTEQEGVTQGEEVQMIRFSLGMSTESWLELVFWVLFACFDPAGGGGASCDWTKRCERLKTLCVEFKKEPKIIIVKKKQVLAVY